MNKAVPARLSPSAKNLSFVPHSLDGDTTPVNVEVFFYSEDESKSDQKKKDGKTDPKDNSEEGKIKEISPCESKERSLDFPSSKLAGQKCNARLKNVDRNVKDSGKSLVKIQVENCLKESNENESVELSENAKSKEKKKNNNSSDSATSGDCDASNKNKNCSEEQQSRQQDTSKSAKKILSKSMNKYTWCGSCKSSSKSATTNVGQGSKTAAAAAAAVAAAHERVAKKRTSSTSPLKRLSRSSLSTESADNNSKVSLNLSKYSPCASRLAASSKILSGDSPGGKSPESPLHVACSKSPVQPSLSLNIHQLQRPANNKPVRSKSVSGADSCVTSPTSDATNLSCSPSGTEILSLEDVSTGNNSKPGLDDQQSAPKTIATVSTVELNLDRDAKWTSNYRSPR